MTYHMVIACTPIGLWFNQTAGKRSRVFVAAEAKISKIVFSIARFPCINQTLSKGTN